MKYRDKCCLVYDHGLFVELAVRLAKDFGRVLYYQPWEGSFPDSKALASGAGLSGVERVKSIWPALDQVDLFVFPDLYDGALQEHLAALGKRVWGARMGEELELYRDSAKQHFKTRGIPIGPHKLIKGTAALREHLKAHKNQFVKISLTRGDGESFHAPHYRMIDPVVTDIEDRLGPLKSKVAFTVEDAIEPAVEAGYDGFTIDGKFPQRSLWGVEVKDRAYVGRVESYAALPAPVRLVNDKLAPTFREYKYRGFWSSEVRVTPANVGYFIDATARAPSPPSELYHLMIGNLADVIWNGAAGILVEPKYTAQWGAQLILFSEWAQQKWQPIDFPQELRDNVKIRNLTVVDGRHYYVPDKCGSSAVGAVVAHGNSMQAAINECKRIAKEVEGHSIDRDAAALNKAEEELEKLNSISAKRKAV